MLDYFKAANGLASPLKTQGDPEEDVSMPKARVNRRSKISGTNNRNRASQGDTRSVINGRPAAGFSDRKSIEELAAEQGTKPTRLEDILGKGADLWGSDEEFEKFVEDIYARRK